MIAADEVHVWHIDLTLPLPPAWAASLDAQEQARAARFASATLQAQFRRARGALRAVLAHYTRRDAASLALVQGAYGKPALASGEVEFNLSHSGSLALLAVAPAGCPVGIDIECMHERRTDIAALLDMVCHASEKAAIASLAGDAQRHAFYALWTRKEAYIKALGLGLQVDPCTVAFMPGAEDSGWSVAEMAAENRGRAWQVRTLEMVTGYAGSICLARGSMRMVELDVAALRLKILSLIHENLVQHVKVN